MPLRREALSNMQVNIGVILQVIIALFGAFFLAFWVSLVIWTFRDVRSRSRDIFAQLLATLMVMVFNLPGLLFYFILRPQETLAEAFERSLEEEALLQDIEERLVCPGCKRKIQSDFIICPDCHTRLKKSCPNCRRLLHLKWNICPYCGAGPASPPEQFVRGSESEPEVESTQL
ncbi:MAG: zinc ribbon domain-containing protein [Anaerolineales bacterium]|nr:MAG: zinc ribbon domain-containing protein [Anaerolineales bacterium]